LNSFLEDKIPRGDRPNALITSLIFRDMRELMTLCEYSITVEAYRKYIVDIVRLLLNFDEGMFSSTYGSKPVDHVHVPESIKEAVTPKELEMIYHKLSYEELQELY